MRTRRWRSGATPVETYFKVSVPAAKSGIAAAVVLGVGRAIGEAMAVMMVSGNVANMPSLFQSVRFLTTAVASEMSYSSGLAAAGAVFHRAGAVSVHHAHQRGAELFPKARIRSDKACRRNYRIPAADRISALMRTLMYVSAGLTCGAGAVPDRLCAATRACRTISWELLSTAPSYLEERIGILPDILNTLYIVMATILLRAAARRGRGDLPD